MPTIQKSLRMPEEIIKEIEDLSRDSAMDFTAAVNELLEEALKMHRCPGVVFTEGTSGKRARIAGAGIEVWEVVAAYKSVGEDFKRLKKTYHWLTDQQLKTAIGYYRLYPEEIDAIVSENEGLTQKEIQRKYPFLSAGKQ
ncbi:MAG: DUF433 domain-containing protein [Deltaproteobacteria bacterium]|nr:DUF433 domain-containing protein [Deltaproteobacteria bacterium]